MAAAHEVSANYVGKWRAKKGQASDDVFAQVRENFGSIGSIMHLASPKYGALLYLKEAWKKPEEITTDKHTFSISEEGIVTIGPEEVFKGYNKDMLEKPVDVSDTDNIILVNCVTYNHAVVSIRILDDKNAV